MDNFSLVTQESIWGNFTWNSTHEDEGRCNKYLMYPNDL